MATPTKKLSTQDAAGLQYQLLTLQQQLQKVQSPQGGTGLTSATPQPLNSAQMMGASGRGADNYSPATSQAIAEASAAGVPMSALGDKNKTGKTNLETPSGFSAPRLTPDQAGGFVKAFGLDGVIDPKSFSGLTAEEANKRLLSERAKRSGQISGNTTFSFNPETLKQTQRAIDKLGFALDSVNNTPFVAKQLKDQNAKNTLDITSKEIGKLFNSTEDLYNAYNGNPQFRDSFDQFIKKGGSLAGVATNVTSTPVTVGQTQTDSEYLANLSNPNANPVAQKQAIDELAPESAIAQNEIARTSNIPEQLKTFYFGDEKSIGILDMKKQQAAAEVKNIEEKIKDDKRTAREKSNLSIEKNQAEVNQQKASIEQNRLQARNYMTAQLAKLGALNTTGAAPLALQTLETQYQMKTVQLDSDFNLFRKGVGITLNETIDKIENDSSDKVLKIQEDLNTSSETVMKEVLKAQQDAEKEIYRITAAHSTKLRERTTKYTQDLKDEAEKNAKKFAALAGAASLSGFTSAGLPTSKNMILSKLEKRLKASRGSDSHANSGVYAAAMNEWIDAGGTTATFVSKFPPSRFANPDDTSLPYALRYAKDSQTTSAADDDLAAKINAAFPDQ